MTKGATKTPSRHWHEATPYATSAEVPAASAYSLGMGWPRQDHRPLLVAACAPQSHAIAAWQQWRAGFTVASLGEIDLAAARLLAQASVRLRDFGVRDIILDRALWMYRHAWITNQLHLRSALDAVRVLSRVDVQALALKGLALLAGAYADIGLRPMFDVDLLVHPKDIEKAFSTLIQSGWRSRHSSVTRTHSTDPLLWPNTVQLKRDKIEVDLHWHALRQDASDVLDRELWNTSIVRHFHQRELRCPHATELLLVTCLHGVVWTRTPHTLWPADAHRLITSGGPIDWNRLVVTAAARRLTLPMYDALLFLKQVLGTDVPCGVLAVLGSTQVSEVECMEHAAMTRNFAEADYAERSAARELIRLRAENHLERSNNDIKGDWNAARHRSEQNLARTGPRSGTGGDPRVDPRATRRREHQ